MNVELVGETKGVGKYQHLSNEEVISAIARHGKIKDDKGKLIKYLMENKHWSPLDMINFIFEIQTSRAISRHIIRHSSLNVQERSQRYSKSTQFEDIELRNDNEEIINPGLIEYLDPITAEDNGDKIDAQTLIRDYLKDINNFYEKLIGEGVAKETARMILPECTSTIITVNGTLRSWLSFLNVRHHEAAQKEIRKIAHEIGLTLEQQLPNVFSQINWRDGWFM